jgi:hypothetical protein
VNPTPSKRIATVLLRIPRRDVVRQWRVPVILLITLVLSSALPIAAKGLAQDQASDGPELWQDSRSSDAPLRGADVVRRPNSDMPDFQ